MNVNEAKLKIEKALGEAQDNLSAIGVSTLIEVEVIENQINDEEIEPIMVFGSLALSADGLDEDDVFYLSIEARVVDGEVDGEALSEAIEPFGDRIELIKARLKGKENMAEAIREMSFEVDSEIEASYIEKLERENARVKRDLKIAIVAAVVMFVLAVAMAVASRLVG